VLTRWLYVGVSVAVLAAAGARGAAAKAAPKAAAKADAKAEDRPKDMPHGRLEWRAVFSGSDLTGWSVDGKANWTVEDGCIVGRQDPDVRGESWLFTDEEFGDFGLMLKFEITQGGNSGVALRIPRIPGHPANLGYEMQIWDADPDYPTGSFWGLPKANAPPGLQLPNQWNEVMIFCVGDTLFTSINGKLGIAYKNRRRAKGRIGFQVHGGPEYKDQVARFKDIWIAPVTPPTPAPSGDLVFKKTRLDPGACEAAAIGDFNNDGKPDIVCGSRWHEGPDWTPHPGLRVSADAAYVLAFDMNTDGYLDVFAGTPTAKTEVWHENPGKPNLAWTPREWVTRRGPIAAMYAVDIDGDGAENDLLPNGDGTICWFHLAAAVSPKAVRHDLGKQGIGSGIGYGDVNNDKRIDIITGAGWWEAPADRAKDKWTWRPEFKLQGTPGLIRALDVNGDGKPDIVYGNAAGYGLRWLEQGSDGGKRTWTEHLIDDTFAQVQAIEFADLNGDGRKEIIAGRRWHAGSIFDEGACEPTALFWFEHEGKGQAWVRHIIDYNGGAGCGMGILVRDLNGDGRPDIVVPGKGGLYLFLNMGKK